MPQEKQVQPRQFSKTETKIIIFFIVLVVGGLIYWLLIAPKYQQLKQAKIDLKFQEQDLMLKTNQLGDLQETQVNYQQFDTDDLNKLNLILPDEQDIPETILQMKSIVEKSGFILSAIDVKEGQTKKSKEAKTEIGILRVDLKLAGGDYQRFKKLLDNFETSLPLVDVQSISFPQSLDNFSLSLQTYYLNQN